MGTSITNCNDHHAWGQLAQIDDAMYRVAVLSATMHTCICTSPTHVTNALRQPGATVPQYNQQFYSTIILVYYIITCIIIK